MNGKNSVLVIAEIGTAHGGNFETAKKLMDAAAEAGADCLKFQIVYADEILHPDTGFVSLPGGTVRLYDRFKELETNTAFYASCAEYAKSLSLFFCASPFGSKSLRELWDLDPFAIKIASPELNHFPLLCELASLEAQSAQNNKAQIPVILSSGVSKAADIEKALEILSDVHDKALLHCVTSYPAPEEEYNLRVIEPLSHLFGIPCGISDHSLHPVLVPVLATACGARIVEKHICLSRENGGLDDPVALPPEDFAVFVKSVRLASRMNTADVIAMAKEEFGSKRVEAVLGSGKKELSPAEKTNYLRTNRSIHFMRSIQAGEILQKKDIAVLRTEKILTPGLSPEFFSTVIGAKLAANAKNGEGVTWDHLVKSYRIT